MKRISSIALLAAMSAIFASNAVAQEGNVTLHIGDPAPPLVIAKWAKGDAVKQLGHGKVNVVEFWATWCGPCKVSIPHLTELAQKYKGKATFIGVDSFEHVPDPSTCYPKVEKFVADMGPKMNYNVAIDGVDGTMGKTWMAAAGQNGIPTAFVVGRDGKIAWIGHPMNGLDEVVGKVIDGSFDSKAEADRQQKAQEQAAAMREKMMKLLAPVSAARSAKDYPKEVAAIDAVFVTNPEMKPNLQMERLVALSQFDSGGAAQYARELAAGPMGTSAEGLNSIAWTIVMDHSPIKQMDPEVAIEIAKKAVAMSKGDPNIEDSLALAYFRANRLADALATQKDAVAKASADKKFDASSLEELKGRLAMYAKTVKPH